MGSRGESVTVDGDASPSASRLDRSSDDRSSDDRYLALGRIEISFDEFTVRAAGHAVALTCMEFDTLAYLMRSAPRVVSQEELFQSVAGSAYQAQSSLMRVHVSNLRRKLGRLGSVVRTVRGRGFQFVGDAGEGVIIDEHQAHA